MIRLTAICAAALMFIEGCDRLKVADTEMPLLPQGFSSIRDIDPRGWAYDDALTFTTDSAGGDLIVAIRHSVDYPYRNLWLEIARQGPDSGAAVIRDTIDMELADPFGLWHGNGIGTSRQVEATVARSIRLDSASTITVRHIMRLDTLPCIEQAGIFVIH